MRPTILIIEDDPIITNLLEYQLRRAGYRILRAPDGSQGLTMAKAKAPDLFLLDLMLPDIDGFQVIEQLRADPQTAATPLLIITARTKRSDREKAMQLGADAYFAKPIDRFKLMALIDSLIGDKPENKLEPSPM